MPKWLFLKSMSIPFAGFNNIHDVYFSQVKIYNTFMPQQAKYNLPDVNSDYNIGKNIIAIRKDNGLSQKELSQKIGISAALLSHYETGKLNTPIEVLIQISITLKTDMNTLVGISDSNNDNPTISSKMMKRIRLIEQLPSFDKKALLKTIDNTLKGAGLDLQ